MRRKARLVFIKFNSLYPQLSHSLLLYHVSLTYQKAIYDDFLSYEINPDKTMLFNNAQEDILGTQEDQQNFETFHTAEFPDD